MDFLEYSEVRECTTSSGLQLGVQLDKAFTFAESYFQINWWLNFHIESKKKIITSYDTYVCFTALKIIDSIFTAAYGHLKNSTSITKNTSFLI